ncbi:MAG: hypothetical protein AAF570_07755, partial [Bacteroidota bacterium]
MRAFLFIGCIAFANFLSAQVTVRLRVYQVQTTIGDCDGFLTGNSDPAWWWTGPGVIDDQCYQTTCNGCTNSVNELLMEETYNCIQDVPNSVQVRFRGCEDDGAGCVAGAFLGICDGNSADRTDNFTVPTTIGTTNIGPFSANSTGCAGTWRYWARWELTGSFISAPGNDDICNATPIALNNTITGNNTCATTQAGEVNSSNGSISPSNSVWYTFTAPASGNVEVSTNFGGTSFDTEIAIYEDNGSTCPGNNWGNLTEVGNNDDIVLLFNLDSEVELECLTPGATYYVQVDGNDASDFGNFQLRVSSLGPPLPTNDDICNAINLGTLNFNGTIGSPTGVSAYNNFCATTQPGEPNPGAFAPDQTVWFTFTTSATAGGEVLFSATNDPGSLGDQIDLQLAVYSSSNGACTGSFSEVDSDYFTPPFSEDMTTQCLQPNTQYWVQVDGSGLNVEGYFGLRISDQGVPRAPNDVICNAVNLGTLNFGGSLNNNNLNNFCAGNAGDPNPSGCSFPSLDPDPTMSVWASFTTGSTVAHEILISAVTDPNNNGDDIDLQLALYSSSNNTCTGALTMIECNYDLPNPFGGDEDMSVFCLDSNTTYFIWIDGSSINQEGFFGLTVSDDNVMQPTNNDICNPTAIGTVPNGGQITLSNQNNYCSDVGPTEPTSLCFDRNHTVWYTFTPPSSGSVEIELINLGGVTGVDLEIAAYEVDTDTCTGFFNELDCYDALTFSIDGADAFRLKCLDTTKTYFIMVDGQEDIGLNIIDDGEFDLIIRDYNITPAPHDTACAAIIMGNPDFGPITLTNQSNFCADNISEPIPSCWGTNQTVWYQFIAPSSGMVHIDADSDPNNTGDYIDLQLA